MSKTSNINSLAALRERREKLSAEETAAKDGLTNSLAAAPAKAKDYALEDLALPVLGIGLAVYVGYRVLRSGKSSGQVAVAAPPQAAAPVAAARQEVAPAPVTKTPSRPLPVPVPAPRPQWEAPVKKSLFNLGTLMTAGKLLIPAAQAIIGVVQNHQTQRDIEEATD